MSRSILFSVFVFFFALTAVSQDKAMNYYLPDTEYDTAIPTPKSVIGHQIGDWHISHDKIVYYLRELARKSDRVKLVEYARSHENRPLYQLFISSPENIARLESIQSSYKQLTDVDNSGSVDIENLPGVIYQGYSIHGNESSGANAAVLVAYYLTAGKSKAVLNTLNDLVIILDPCLNPDGLQRFSTWANSHKGSTLVSDPNSREFNEVWPRGRTNHYWFDLNRDWLLLTHPESVGRIKAFHEWNPLILTDHHEMGTNSTFFFQPGIPSRTNPNTPQLNQTLTEKIGRFHAAALDSIGSLYYTKASFDDFYYGKGSTYPDANACIGILFEQASSRGHLQESVNGLLSFPFTIKNQVVTSISTQKAAINMRKELLEYKRDFFKNSKKEAAANPIKGYLISDVDRSKLNRFLEILLTHKVDVYPLTQNITVKGKSFKASESYVIPSEQKQYKMVKTIFETVTSFPDSLFYDVSTWTMPLAFDIDYTSLNRSQYQSVKKTEKLNEPPANKGSFTDVTDSYAYIMDWKDSNAPKALYKLLDKGLIVKVLKKEFYSEYDGKKMKFAIGSILVPLQNQDFSKEDIASFLKDVATNSHVYIYGVNTGWGSEGMTLGHPSMRSLEKPEIMALVGSGVDNADVGEIWHLLDTRYNIPISLIEKSRFNARMLDRYNTIILADGSYRFGESTTEALQEWIENGGSLILTKDAINWGLSSKTLSLKTAANKDKDKSSKATNSYDGASAQMGSRILGGSIFKVDMDLSHPLCYGYPDSEMAVFRSGTKFYEPTSNVYATPVRYSDSPLLSGYIPRGTDTKAKGKMAVSVHGKGRGTIICISDNLNFRGYWWGGSKLFANAIFFADIINRRTKQ